MTSAFGVVHKAAAKALRPVVRNVAQGQRGRGAVIHSQVASFRSAGEAHSHMARLKKANPKESYRVFSYHPNTHVVAVRGYEDGGLFR